MYNAYRQPFVATSQPLPFFYPSISPPPPPPPAAVVAAQFYHPLPPHRHGYPPWIGHHPPPPPPPPLVIYHAPPVMQQHRKLTINELRREFINNLNAGNLHMCKVLLHNQCQNDEEERELLREYGGDDCGAVLYYAARYGDGGFISWMLRGGCRQVGFGLADVQFKATTFLLAARFGNLDCCKALVDGCRNDGERRKLLNAGDWNDGTVLHHAAQYGQDNVVQWLLSNKEGYDRFKSMMKQDQFRRTALHTAAEHGNLNCCKALVDACRNEDERRELLNAVDQCCMTALHYLVSRNHGDIVQWLLRDDEGGHPRVGFDLLMARDKKERTVLHMAARKGNLSCCKALVDGCRDDDERRELLNAVDDYHMTALHHAASDGYEDIIQWLLSDDEGGGRRLGFNGLMARDRHQKTVLHHCSDLSCCKALVNACRDDDERRELLNAVDRFERTALHYTSRNEIVKWLLSDDEGGGRRLGFDGLMARDREKYTALHYAAHDNHPRACQALLDGCRDGRERTALIQAVDIKGNTVLHHASRYRSIDVIKWILQSPEMQFIYNLKDNDGFTALHLLILGNFYEQYSIEDFADALLFDTEAENEVTIDDDNNDDNQKDKKRIATKIDPNIGCGLDWNPFTRRSWV